MSGHALETPVAWGRVIDGKAITVSLERTPANDEPLYASVRAPRLPDIEALCRDYAQRWLGKDWSLMDDDDEAELRIQAHRWLKCLSAVTSPSPAARAERT